MALLPSDVEQDRSSGDGNSDISVTGSSRNVGPICYLCNKHFASKCSLSKHLKNVHGIAPVNPRSAFTCDECSATFSYRNRLLDHKVLYHKSEMRKEHHEFSTEDDFLAWQEAEKKKVKARFVKRYTGGNGRLTPLNLKG